MVGAVWSDMLRLAVCCSCGATACYLSGLFCKQIANSFDNITRVTDFKGLDDLLKEKAKQLLVVVSGKVGSAAPINSKNDGSSGFVLEEKIERVFENKLEDGGFISKSVNLMFQRNEAPWYLEDNTGDRVNVVGGLGDVLFVEETLKVRTVASLWDTLTLAWIKKPEEGSQVIYGSTLATGTYVTVFGEAVRDEAGNLMIQKLNDESFMIFTGEGTFDKVIGDWKSSSEFCFFYSKIFGVIALAAAVHYGVGYIRRWKKNNRR